MKFKRDWLFWIIAVLLVVGTLIVINYYETQAWKHRNLNPRIGTVWMTQNHTESKRCDGSTLLYTSYNTQGGQGPSISATVPNSEECS